MKKVLFLVLACALCVCIMGCSKDEKKKKNSTVKIYHDGVEISGTFLIGTGQTKELTAILTNASGAIVTPVAIAWTCSSGLGTFSSPTNDDPDFTAVNTTTTGTITVDCDGIKKTINVQVATAGTHGLKISILMSDNDILPTAVWHGQIVNLKAVVQDAVTDVEISSYSSNIVWSGSSGLGAFSATATNTTTFTAGANMLNGTLTASYGGTTKTVNLKVAPLTVNISMVTRTVFILGTTYSAKADLTVGGMIVDDIDIAWSNPVITPNISFSELMNGTFTATLLSESGETIYFKSNLTVLSNKITVTADPGLLGGAPATQTVTIKTGLL